MNIYKKFFNKSVSFILNVYDSLFVTLLFGKKKNVEHIWKTNNYQITNRFYWSLIQKPLQQRGIYTPVNLNKVQNLNNFWTYHNEHIHLDNLLNKIEQNEIQNLFIDIGAADGVDASNSFNLALKGYKGYMFEYNDSHFAKLATIYRDFPNVSLFKTKITPKNITQFLNSLDLPEIIKVINLDIDSYDYFILEQLLKNFKFQILILEINPMFPSTIDFTVTFKEDHSYDSNMFQGSSISMTYNLLAKNDYSVVHIDRGFALAVNNKFLNNKVKPITFNEIDDILDKSIINNDPKRWERYKEYRELDIDEAILKIKELFKNYDNYYLEKNYRNS
jgi:hypothetical protein